MKPGQKSIESQIIWKISLVVNLIKHISSLSLKFLVLQHLSLQMVLGQFSGLDWSGITSFGILISEPVSVP